MEVDKGGFLDGFFVIFVRVGVLKRKVVIKSGRGVLYSIGLIGNCEELLIII